MQPPLTSPFRIGDVEIANRVLLAPLAGIGNWFVRLQARRHGAGLAVSEMVSSFGLHYRNERTLTELLRLHPDEHPVSVQLFGQDPDVMRSAAEIVAGAGADLIDINMGCPVKKVCKTGAGAALLGDPDLAVRDRDGGPRGRRDPRDRQGPLRAGPRRARGLRPRPSARRGGGRRRHRIPPARRGDAAQGAARLRAGPGAGRADRGPRDHLRRARQRRGRAPRLRGLGRGRRDDRPRLARQPLDLRGAHRQRGQPRRSAKR